MKALVEEITLYVKSRYPIIYLVSSEENRAENLIREAARNTQKKYISWSITQGFSHKTGTGGKNAALDALSAIISHPGPALFVLKDFHVFLEDKIIVRKLRDTALELRHSYKTVFIISAILVLPPGLDKSITPIDIPLPGTDELKQTLMQVVEPLKEKNKITTDFDDDFIEKIVNASRGLTQGEARNLYSRLMVDDKTFDENDLPRVVAEKKKLVRKSGLLEYYDFTEEIGSVGGLDRLKTWLSQRGLAFSKKARDFGLPEPKGLLLLGVQGCGKSLAAKVTASLWNLPLLKLDVGKIFDAYLGASEKNIRDAIQVAESLSPNILWVDEIDKAFAGMGSGHSGDSGASARVFGTFLTWMQEKSVPVFVIATANNIEHLPPELLRKGRFDEIFFIDLPTPEERTIIFTIHLKKRKRDPENFNLPLFVEKSEGFTGAEIEQLVISGLYRAFAENRELSDGDILQEITETVPLSMTYKERISGLRSWAQNRARPAT